MEDAAAREKYVAGLQKPFEETVAQFLAGHPDIECLMVTHTPLPATPLRKLENPRAQSVRNLLKRAKGIFTYSAEQASSELSLTSDEAVRDSFLDASEQQGNIHLAGLKMGDEKFDPTKVGATYFFRDSRGEVFVFNLQSQQLPASGDAAQKQGEVQLWGGVQGSLRDPKVRARVDEVMGYVLDHATDKTNAQTMALMVQMAYAPELTTLREGGSPSLKKQIDTLEGLAVDGDIQKLDKNALRNLVSQPSLPAGLAKCLKSFEHHVGSFPSRIAEFFGRGGQIQEKVQAN